MSQKVIHIPIINDTPADFVKLFRIWEQVKGDEEDILFDFSDCSFLRPNAVAFLGGLARLIKSRGGKVSFNWDTCSNGAVRTNLCENGFCGMFNYPISAKTGESIPYREHIKLDMKEIMDYLTDDWLGRGWVQVSHQLRDAIVGHMWEIYNNAFEHSNTEIGMFSCGQHYKIADELILSAVDFGHGIPAKVREFVGTDPRAQDLPADLCLRWAFKSGNSTGKGEVARGLGLDLLKEFIKLNQGKLEIYSNEGYVIIDKAGERFDNTDINFEGTLVHITLRCNKMLYHFKDETDPAY